MATPEYRLGVKPTKNKPLIDLTGQRFGRLTVLGQGERIGDRIGWICRCDCGNIKTIDAHAMKAGHIKSCGCYGRENAAKRATKHSLCGTRIYHAYHNMKKRCYNPNSDHYKWYGGENKGICDEWMGEDGFKNFAEWSFANGYTDELTIDRIDNSKGYSPDNCRWVTPKQNCRNKRNNHLITIDGETKTLIEWCDVFGINDRTVRSRIRIGWDEVKAITTPKLRERRCKKDGNK